MSANYHLYYDEFCSKDPEYRKILEQLEIISRKERRADQAEKKRAEQTWKRDPVLARFLKDTKKMEETRRLRHC